MKHTRQFFALLLALVLTLGLCVTAFADGETTGSITISRAKGDTKEKELSYTLYRIFDIESYDDTAKAYAYKIADGWADFFETGAGKTYIQKLDNDYVTWTADTTNDGTAVKAFAEAAIAYAEATPVASAATGAIAENQASTTINNLPLGYYLIDSSLGSLCALTPTKPNANVVEKNSHPTIDKVVFEGNATGKTNDGAVGDTVTFQVTVNVTEGASGYVVHDSMGEGLALGTVTVKKGETELTADTDYTLTTTNADGCTFELALHDDKISVRDTVVVTYTATITADAVKHPEGVVNEAELEYGDGNRTTRQPTRTYTWELDVFKFTKNGEDEKPLAGAQFLLYKEETGENQSTIKKYASFDANKVFSDWKNTKEEATALTSDEDGKINVKGLDAGTYYLEETAAPKGYNKLKDPVRVVISSEERNDARTHTVTYGAEKTTAGDSGVKVENKTGTELPSTGGIGTTIFYVLGSAMALGAVILLVTKKRMAA